MKRLSLIFLLILSLFLFFGCTSLQSETKNYDSSLVGTWLASSSGIDYLLRFDADGNWKIKQISSGDSATMAGTYFTNDDILYLQSNDEFQIMKHQQNIYVVDGNTLKLRAYYEDSLIEEMVYTKIKNFNQVLFLGQPSSEEKIIVSEKYSYDVSSANSFFNATYDDLRFYELIILDQSSSSEKSISMALGESIQKYVQNGGKLIVVMNSAIYSNNESEDYIDSIGWQATLGGISPAYCGLNIGGVPTCKEGNEISVSGRIWNQDSTHLIMQGIEVVPIVGSDPIKLTTFSVTADAGAKTIAYIKAENKNQTFPAIIEKKPSVSSGVVIYFNYNPVLTKEILENTLNYLIK
jgi:outer membrane biogenesis lipoprotein LolB